MNTEKYRDRLRSVSAVGLSTAAMAGVFGHEESANPENTNNISPSCPRYLRSERPNKLKYLVCINYVLKAAGYQVAGGEFGSKVNFYRYGKSPVTSDKKYYTEVFETQYRLNARRQIEQQVAQWPNGEYFVDNRIEVEGINTNRVGNRAVVYSSEDWLVQNSDGSQIYTEESQEHTTTMCRIRDSLRKIDEWMVVANDNKLIDCKAFSARVLAGDKG